MAVCPEAGVRIMLELNHPRGRASEEVRAEPTSVAKAVNRETGDTGNFASRDFHVLGSCSRSLR